MLDTVDQSIMANRFDQGRGILANMSPLNLGRITTALIQLEGEHTPAIRNLGDYIMREISGGTRTQQNPHYKHKEEGKPSVKKDHEHSGTQPSRYKKKKAAEEKKRNPFPNALRPRQTRWDFEAGN